MEKIKLLFIMPSMIGGGAERVLINLLNMIDNTRYDVRLINIEQKGKLWHSVPDHVNKSVLYPHPLISKIAVFLLRKFNINVLLKIFGKKITGNYDTAISFLDSVHTEFLFLNKANIKKRIAVVHSSYITNDNKSKFIRGSYKNTMHKRYQKIDTIVTVSKESLLQFKELFGEYPDMRVIYNPISRDNILIKSKDKIPEDLTTSSFKIVAVGNLLPVKGYDLLIDACILLKKRNINFKTFILGEGYLKEELQEKVSKNHLDSLIHFKGFVSNPYSWMLNSDLFVMTSKAEGLPTVLCEALILGTPALVPNVPGCREVVDYGKYGFIFDRNTKDMADKIEIAITNKDIYQNYRKKALERGKIFNDKKVLKQYYDIL